MRDSLSVPRDRSTLSAVLSACVKNDMLPAFWENSDAMLREILAVGALEERKKNAMFLPFYQIRNKQMQTAWLDCSVAEYAAQMPGWEYRVLYRRASEEDDRADAELPPPVATVRDLLAAWIMLGDAQTRTMAECREALETYITRLRSAVLLEGETPILDQILPIIKRMVQRLDDGQTGVRTLASLRDELNRILTIAP